ncbi:MAG: MGMT family protein [Candidatus Methanomethylicaceae archaeon]
MAIKASLFQLPAGWVAMAYTDDLRLIANSIPQQTPIESKASLSASLRTRRIKDFAESPPDPFILGEVKSALTTGMHRLELSFDGIPRFYREVFNIARMIPYGRVVTYQMIAKALGRPRAQRAVGNAMRVNPFPIIVPCHRVIRSDLSLGGYSGIIGSPIKESLLRREGVAVSDGKVMEKYLLAPDKLSCRSSLCP